MRLPRLRIAPGIERVLLRTDRTLEAPAFCRSCAWLRAEAGVHFPQPLRSSCVRLRHAQLASDQALAALLLRRSCFLLPEPRSQPSSDSGPCVQDGWYLRPLPQSQLPQPPRPKSIPSVETSSASGSKPFALPQTQAAPEKESRDNRNRRPGAATAVRGR